MKTLQYAGIAAVGGLVAFLLYKRLRQKVVTYSQIIDWLNKNHQQGDVCYVIRLSDVPAEVREDVHQKTKASRALNGYKDEGSVVVTLMDKDGNQRNVISFMGTELDRDLVNAFGGEKMHRINC